MAEMTLEQQQALALASARLRSQNIPQSQPADPSEGGLPFSPFGVNTGLTMPQSVSRFMAGAGKAFTDIGRGAGQMMGIGPTAAETDETRKLDAPLMNTGAGIAGNLTGGIAATAPAMAIPGVNSYTGAAALGSALGAAIPTGEGDSRALNMGLGAASGMGGQALGNLLSRTVRPIQSTLTPEQSRLAQVALDNNIPLGAAELTGSKPLKIANSVLSNLPFTAGAEADRVGNQVSAFNLAALSRAGINSDVATQDVLNAQKKALGNTFENISANNALNFNKGLAYDLQSVADTASRRLPKDKAVAFQSTIDDLLSEAPNGVMDGTKYQAWRGELGRMAKGTDTEAHYFGQAKKALDAEFNKQISPADSEAWKQASQQYANLKTILGAMGGNSPNTVSGNIAPAQLGMALSQAMGKEGKALGRGDLNDLAKAGNLFLREPPDSYTAQRQFYQSLLTGGGGAGIGAAGAAMTGNDPMKGAGIGLGLGATSLVTPKLAQAILQSPLAQKYMTNQAGNSTAQALAELLQNSGRSLGAAAPLLLMNR